MQKKTHNRTKALRKDWSNQEENNVFSSVRVSKFHSLELLERYRYQKTRIVKTSLTRVKKAKS